MSNILISSGHIYGKEIASYCTLEENIYLGLHFRGKYLSRAAFQMTIVVSGYTSEENICFDPHIRYNNNNDSC